MSNALSKVLAHYAGLATRKIEVPEWGLTLHVSPVTMRERVKLARHQLNRSMEYYLDLLVMKARDAEGKPLFDEEARIVMMDRADSDVILRVAAQIDEPAPGPGAVGESSPRLEATPPRPDC